MSYDKVSLLLPMNGTNNGTEFPDWSPVPKTVTRHGNTLPIIKTDQSKFYGSSCFFPNNPSGSSAALGVELPVAPGAGAFTFRCWFRRPAAASSMFLFDNRATSLYESVSNSNTAFSLYSRGTLSDANKGQLTVLYGAGSTILQGNTDIQANTWHHVEFSRDDSDVMRGFLDGNQQFSATVTNNFSNAFLSIGGINGGVTHEDRYMQDAEVVIGEALHTANFTPPARLVGTISNAAVGAGKILDVNGDPAERTVIAVPRSAPVRIWSDVSNASGEFSIQAPAGIDHSVVALADEATLYNDIVHRVIPE